MSNKYWKCNLSFSLFIAQILREQVCTLTHYVPLPQDTDLNMAYFDSKCKDVLQGCCLSLWNLNFRFSVISYSITLAQVFCGNFYLLNFKDTMCTKTSFLQLFHLSVSCKGKPNGRLESPFLNWFEFFLVQMGCIGAFDLGNGYGLNEHGRPV